MQKKSISPRCLHEKPSGQLVDSTQRTLQTPSSRHWPRTQSESLAQREPTAPGVGTG